jgi:hypothetical protein
MSDNRIEFSETGRAEERALWALCPATGSETLRAWAMCLLADLRDRYSNAEVWINGRKYSPTPEELDAYRKHIAAISQKESLLRARAQAQDVVEEPEEPQPVSEEPARELLLSTASDGLLIDPKTLESDLDF